jgi:hypothetical protein
MVNQFSSSASLFGVTTPPTQDSLLSAAFILFMSETTENILHLLQKNMLVLFYKLRIV